MSVLSSLHTDDYAIFIRVVTLGLRVAEEMGLETPVIVPDPNPQESYSKAEFGRCHSSGRIEIAVRWKRPTGEWLGRMPEKEIFNTLAHELAHIRYPHHKQTFWDFHEDVLAHLTQVRRW